MKHRFLNYFSIMFIFLIFSAYIMNQLKIALYIKDFTFCRRKREAKENICSERQSIVANQNNTCTFLERPENNESTFLYV